MSGKRPSAPSRGSNRQCDHDRDTLQPLDYAPVEEPRARWGRSALLCLVPFVIVGILVCAELAYVLSAELAYVLSAGNRVTGGTLPPFLRWSARVEFLSLLLALLNVPLMHWHLSALRSYSLSKPIAKVVVVLLAAIAYLGLVIGAFWFVLLMHLV